MPASQNHIFATLHEVALKLGHFINFMVLFLVVSIDLRYLVNQKLKTKLGNVEGFILHIFFAKHTQTSQLSYYFLPRLVLVSKVMSYLLFNGGAGT